MAIPFTESTVQVLESIFPYESGTPMFNVTVGVCLLAWVVGARLFMALCASKRGVLSAFIGLIVPAVIGLVAYNLTLQYAVPSLTFEWAESVLPWAAFGVFLLLSIAVISSRIFALSSLSAIIIYVVATAGAVGAFFFTQVAMGFLEVGGGQVERKEEKQNDLESLL